MNKFGLFACHSTVVLSALALNHHGDNQNIFLYSKEQKAQQSQFPTCQKLKVLFKQFVKQIDTDPKKLRFMLNEKEIHEHQKSRDFKLSDGDLINCFIIGG